jgi:hypothetical protein
VAIAPLIVQVRTAGINQLRSLGAGFRQASRAGSQAAAAMRRDYDRAIVTLNRANAEVARLRREFNRAPSQETARALHMAAMAARMAARNVDDLSDQLRQANRQATSLAGRLGAVAAAAMTLGSGMSGRSQFMAAAITGLVALAPALGAALQGALLAGLGGIGLGAAIVAAFKDEDIKQVWKDTFAGIGADLKLFGKQLGPALVDSANMFRRAWGQARDYVAHLFADLGSTIGPLTSGLIGMLREMGPGLKQAFAVAVPVLRELAAMLPGLGRAMGDFFDSISESKAGALKGIRFLVLALAGSIMILGNAIEFLSKWFDFWTTAAEKVYSALGKIPLLGRPFKEFAEVLQGINDPTEGASGQLKIMAGTELAVAQASRDAAKAVHELSAQMDVLFGRVSNSREAARAYEEAIDALTESVKENGTSLDIHTEKGRANEAAVDAIAKKAYEARKAAIEMAGGQDASAAAVNAANAKYGQQIEELAALMRQLGFSKEQIDTVLGAWRDLANAPNITKTITVRTVVLGGNAKTGASGGLSGSQLSGEYTGGGGRASGGPVQPGRTYMVGERGPELVTFGSNGYVHSNAASRRMMADSLPGGSWGSGTLRVLVAPAPAAVGNPYVEGFLQALRAGLIRMTVDRSNRVVLA